MKENLKKDIKKGIMYGGGAGLLAGILTIISDPELVKGLEAEVLGIGAGIGTAAGVAGGTTNYYLNEFGKHIKQKLHEYLNKRSKDNYIN